MVDFFTTYLINTFGSFGTLFGVGAILAGIGVIIGKWSSMLLFVMMSIYFLVMGIILFGAAAFVPVLLISIAYFGFQLYKWLGETG